jgi:hypothetical protein
MIVREATNAGYFQLTPQVWSRRTTGVAIGVPQ